MKTRSTQSQMNRNRVALDKHQTACTECHKPMNETEKGLELCQLHSSHRPTTSTNRERATRSLSSLSFDSPSNTPVFLNKNDQDANPNNMILADQVDSLAVSVPDSSEDKPEQSNEIVITDSSNDGINNSYAGLQQKKSTKKPTPYPKYKGNIDNNVNIITSPFSSFKKSSASATPSLTRLSRKTLDMIDPNNTTPLPAELDETPQSTRKPRKRSSKSPPGKKLPLSPSNTTFDMEHSMPQTSSPSVIPKIRIKLSPTGAPVEKASNTVDQEIGAATRRSKASNKPKPCIAATSTKTPITPEQKTSTTPRIRLIHYPAQSSSKKPPTASQGPSTATPPGNSLPKPKAPSAREPLDTKKEFSHVPSRRRASVTRRARAEPYITAKPQRRSSNYMVQETCVSSQEKGSSQQRRSARIRAGKKPNTLKKESALPTVSHDVIAISSDEDPSEPFDKPKRRASKRKASLLTGSSEPITINSRQSQDTDDVVIKPRSKIRKKTLALEMSAKAGALSNVSKRKASCLADPADSIQSNEPRRKAIKRTSPAKSRASSSVVVAAAFNKRTLRKRSLNSFNIESNAGAPFNLEEAVSVSEEEMGMCEAEDDEKSTASEEGTDVDDGQDEEEDNKEESVEAGEDDFVDFLQMIKEDPVVGSFRLNKDILTVSEKALGDGQVGAIFAGTYDGLPAACKTMGEGVNEESFYFQAFKEITFALKLAHCRNIIQYYGWTHSEFKGNGKGKFYLAQRRIDNGDARSYLLERGTFSPNEVLHAATCLFSALSDAHAADIGIVDLKLENYLIDDSGSGYLTDLGSCVEFYGRGTVNLLDEGVTWTKSVAAPEMVHKKEFSKASDVFMGTLMIVELMTGLLSDYDFEKIVLQRKASGAVNFSSEAIDSCYDFLFSLLAEGLDTKASNRPTADEMLTKLTKLKKERSPEA